VLSDGVQGAGVQIAWLAPEIVLAAVSPLARPCTRTIVNDAKQTTPAPPRRAAFHIASMAFNLFHCLDFRQQR